MATWWMRRWLWGSVLLLCGLATAAVAQDPDAAGPGPTPGGEAEAAPRQLRLGVTDAVRLATANNSDLKVSFYEHLIERTRVSEAEAAFEPLFVVGSSAGVNQVVFPQIFPTGNIGPDGQPEFFQTIVTDSTVVANWNGGFRGLLPTGATWELMTSTNYRDREAGGLIDPSFGTTTSINFTQPILRNAWLQYNYAAIRQTEYAERQSRQRYRLSVINKIFEVHQAYWNFVFAVQDLEVKKSSLALAERLLEINHVKVDSGAFAPIEIVSAESGVANRVTDVIVAENSIKDNADVLKRLILPFSSLDEWDIELTPADERLEGATYRLPAIKECIDIAFAERPDLTEARLALRSRDISVAVADNETLPKLDVTGNASFTGLAGSFGDSFGDGFGEAGAETWGVGISVEVPLGNKAARARLSRSRLERDQALMSYRNLQISAVEAVRRAYRNVLIAEKTIASHRKATELKKEELKNEQVKLDANVTTNFEVLRIQDDLAQRQSELLRALVDYRIAVAELASAMGSSLEVLKWPIH